MLYFNFLTSFVKLAMAERYEFIKSQRGGDILCLNDYKLHINYRRGDKISFKSRHKNCKFTAITEHGNLLSFYLLSFVKIVYIVILPSIYSHYFNLCTYYSDML